MRPFPKGQSGNPSGRPSGYAEFSHACRERSAEAFETILRIMRWSKDESMRLAASKAVLERAWGKPLAPVAITGDVNFVLRAPDPIASSERWEREIELQRGEYEAIPENEQAGSAVPARGILNEADDANGISGDVPDWARDNER